MATKNDAADAEAADESSRIAELIGAVSDDPLGRMAYVFAAHSSHHRNYKGVLMPNGSARDALYRLGAVDLMAMNEAPIEPFWSSLDVVEWFTREAQARGIQPQQIDVESMVKTRFGKSKPGIETFEGWFWTAGDFGPGPTTPIRQFDIVTVDGRIGLGFRRQDSPVAFDVRFVRTEMVHGDLPTPTSSRTLGDMARFLGLVDVPAGTRWGHTR